jgi:hypothetical protein
MSPMSIILLAAVEVLQWWAGIFELQIFFSTEDVSDYAATHFSTNVCIISEQHF